MKQTLVLCPGLPRSGSTSLWTLLGLQGVKEPQYLSVLANETDHPSFYPASMRERFCNYMIGLNEQRLKLYPPYSLDTYFEYITQQPFDFSQSYWLLSEDYLKEIKQSLPHFNIKIILLYREPVQRLYSYCNMICNGWSCNDSPNPVVRQPKDVNSGMVVARVVTLRRTGVRFPPGPPTN